MQVELTDGPFDGLLTNLPIQTMRVLIPTVYKVDMTNPEKTLFVYEDAVYLRPIGSSKAYFFKYQQF